MNRKFWVSLVILSFTILVILLLQRHAIILSAILILLGYVKHRLCPIKNEFAWFLTICLGGACTEFILINVGHGWTYTDPDLWGIPIWMPLFWGLIGTTTIVLYDSVSRP